MQRTVEFRSAFANQWQFDEEGTPTAPGARELAEAIVAALQQRGVTAGDIQQHSNHGWAFDTQLEQMTFHNLVNPMEGEASMTVQMKNHVLKTLLLKRPGKHFAQYVQTLSEALRQIPQVSEIMWEPEQ